MCTLCYMNDFSQICFLYVHSLPFVLNIKYYSPSKVKWSMLYIHHWQIEWMNEWIRPWLSVWTDLFISIHSSCLYILNNKFYYFCLGIPEVCLWVKYDNVVLHSLPIVRLSFTYPVTLRWIRLHLTKWTQFTLPV
jgi:hypothetical protein